jgi:hypothetical protein
VNERGYSPSYREIMNGLSYNSVATVAVHVNNLIKRGHLRKRDHSARSLELVNALQPAKITSNQVNPNEEKWLVEKVEHVFQEVERLGPDSKKTGFERLATLIGALRILGLDGAAQSFAVRLNILKTPNNKVNFGTSAGKLKYSDGDLEGTDPSVQKMFLGL